MPQEPASPKVEVALVLATCGAALAFAVFSLSPAFAQTLSSDSGLRGAATGAAPSGASTRPPPVRGLSADAGSAPYTPPPASYSAGAGEVAPESAINYGKARKPIRRPLPNPAPKTGKRPLPQLEPYKTSYEARRRVRAAAAYPDAPQMQPPTGVAVQPTILARPRKQPEAKPFDPIGISVGSLRLNPYLEGYGGHDDNPNRVTNPSKGSAVVRGEIGTTIRSQWANHQLNGELRLGYSGFPNVKGANRPDGSGKIDSRIDVLRDTTIDLGGAFSISTLRPGSPELQPGTSNAVSTNQPITWSTSGYLGATHKFNRLEASLRGTIERTQSGDATFSDGSTQRLSLNDYTTLGLRPRLSYEVSPAFKPFVEATIDRRTYDHTLDVNGYRRSSSGLAVRAGATIEIARTLTGEASGGYIQREYDDYRLVKLRGPSVDAALIWTATPLTTVSLRGGTTVNETNIANASGAIARKITGEISHALLRNVTITGAASYQVTSYQGDNLNTSAANGSTGINERLLTGTIKADYNLTRTVVIRASYAYERMKSTAQGADYTSNVFLLGLRLQR